MEEHQWLEAANIVKGNSAWFEIPNDIKEIRYADSAFDSFISSHEFGEEKQRLDKDLEVEKMRWKKSCSQLKKKFEKFDEVYNKIEFLQNYSNFHLINETVDAKSTIGLFDTYSARVAEVDPSNKKFLNKKCINGNIEKRVEASESIQGVQTKTVDDQKCYNGQNCLHSKITEKCISESVVQSVMEHCENVNKEKKLEKVDENLKKHDVDEESTSQLGMASNNVAGENFAGEAERIQNKTNYRKYSLKKAVIKSNKKGLEAPDIDVENVDAPTIPRRRVNTSKSISDYSICSGSSCISYGSFSYEIPQILITQSSKPGAVPIHWLTLESESNYEDLVQKMNEMSWFEYVRESHSASSLEEWFFGSKVEYDEVSSESEDDLWGVDSFSDCESEFATSALTTENGSFKKIKKKKEKKNVTVNETENSIEYVNAITYENENENEFLNEEHEYILNENKPYYDEKNEKKKIYDVDIEFEENIIMQSEDHLQHKIEYECLENAFENETPWEFLSLDQIRYVIGLMKREIWAAGTCPVLAHSLKPSLYFLYSGTVNFVQKGFFTGKSVLFSKNCKSFIMAEEVINDLCATASVVVAEDGDAILWTLERSNFDTKVKEMLLLRQTKVVQTERFLTSVPVINSMHPDDIKEIAKKCKVEVFQANQVVYRENRPGEMFYVIASGTVVTMKPINSDVAVKIGEHGPTDYFGFMGIERKNLSNMFVAAKTALKVLCLDRTLFEKYLGHYRKKLRSVVKQSYIKTNLRHSAQNLTQPIYAATWTSQKIAQLVFQIQKLKGNEPRNFDTEKCSFIKPCWTLIPETATVHAPSDFFSVPIKSCLQKSKTKIYDFSKDLFSSFIYTVVSVNEDTLLPSACILDDSDF